MGSANERVKETLNNGSDQILLRHNMIRLLAFTVSVLVLAETSYAQERPPIFQQMFKTYGFESFGQVEKIRYTFNIPGLNLSRSWEWEPKTDLISYEAKIKTANR